MSDEQKDTDINSDDWRKKGKHRNRFCLQHRFALLTAGEFSEDESESMRSAKTPLEFFKPYIKNLFKLAKEFQIRIVLTMHALPGSHTGEPSSGCVTAWNSPGGRKQQGVAFFVP